jgi:hypothetical protein
MSSATEYVLDHAGDPRMPRPFSLAWNVSPSSYRISVSW